MRPGTNKGMRTIRPLPLSADGRRRLEVRVLVPAPIEAIFAHLAEPLHLDGLTPDWLRFRILDPEPPIEIVIGRRITYRLEPPCLLTYVQDRGPYSYFRHVHLFEEDSEEDGNGGTWVTDVVEYSGPFGRGRFGRFFDGLFVEPDLVRLFEHRCTILERWTADASSP